MRNQTYVSRREAQSTWARNRNTVRHTPKTLGSISQGMILGVLVLIVGLIYVAEGTKATNYDYEISAVETEIADLTAKKEDLAVESARLNSATVAEDAEVALAMEEAVVSGYAER